MIEFLEMPPPAISIPKNDFGEVAGSAIGDHPTATDTLGFSPYVEALVAFLLSNATNPPFTVSIEGEWGSGKSSFMQQLEQLIAETSRKVRSIERRNFIYKFRERLPLWLGGNEKDNPPTAATTENTMCEACTIEFNAWRHDKQDQLWAAFALSVSKSLRSKVGFARAWWGDFQLFAMRLSFPGLLKTLFALGVLSIMATGLHLFKTTAPFVDSALNFAGSLFTLSNDLDGRLHKEGFLGAIGLALLGVLSLIHKVYSPMEKALKKYLKDPNYSDHASFIETFHEDFNRVVTAYAGNKRVFVFIDDLDRCDVPKAAELMQALNLMIGDSGNLVFVIGMDREKVAAGIALKYKEIIDILPEYKTDGLITPDTSSTKTPAAAPSNGSPKPDSSQTSLDRAATTPAKDSRNYQRFGSSYLEKFIQLTFSVPTISSAQGVDRFLTGLIPSPAAPGTSGRFWARFQTWLAAIDNGKQVISPVPPLHRSEGTGAMPSDVPPTTQERIEQIQVTLGKDRNGVRLAVEMVAPVFNYNPRRIKQFINAFRLAMIIYSRQGVLDTRNDVPQATPYQIAKVISLLQRFPDLRLRLMDDSSLFETLEKDALAVASDPLFKHAGVRKVLSHGLAARINQEQEQNPFSLQGVNLAFVLSVLPRREYVPPQAPPPVNAASTGGTQEATGANGAAEEAQPAQGVDPNVYTAVENQLKGLGDQYVEIRRKQSASPSRTRNMTDLVYGIQSSVSSLPPAAVEALLQERVRENSDGSRIVALAIAEKNVSPTNKPFLLAMFDEFRSPFEHYWCIKALIAHFPCLSRLKRSR